MDRVQVVSNLKGIVSRTLYDALGRTTKTIANYTGSAETAHSDVAAEYLYDLSAHTMTVQADEPSSAYQQTAYVYGVTTTGGSALDSNDLVAAIQYADPSSGAASSSQQETF